MLARTHSGRRMMVSARKERALCIGSSFWDIAKRWSVGQITWLQSELFCRAVPRPAPFSPSKPMR
jgi:hypothetical protein